MKRFNKTSHFIRLKGYSSHSYGTVHQAGRQEHERLTSCFTSVGLQTLPLRARRNSSKTDSSPSLRTTRKWFLTIRKFLVVHYELHATGTLCPVNCSQSTVHHNITPCRKKRPLQGIPETPFKHYNALLATSPTNVYDTVEPHKGAACSGWEGVPGVL